MPLSIGPFSPQGTTSPASPRCRPGNSPRATRRRMAQKMFNKRCTESIIGCLTWKSTPDPGTRDGIARRSLFMHKLIALLLLLSPIAHAGMVGAVIDLTDPGALESLRDCWFDF